MLYLICVYWVIVLGALWHFEGFEAVLFQIGGGV